jgi:hypothetical protein|tara:strand:- start:1252 stop:1461 length:210 start_codon:yes stop_codon:yes gene_type:complete
MVDPKLKAMRKYYSSLIEIKKEEFNVYLENPVGIGDHSNLFETMDGILSKIADSEEKLNVLQKYYGLED